MVGDFLLPSHDALEKQQVHLGALLEQYLLPCEVHCGMASLKTLSNQRGLLVGKNLVYNVVSSDILFSGI